MSVTSGGFTTIIHGDGDVIGVYYFFCTAFGIGHMVIILVQRFIFVVSCLFF